MKKTRTERPEEPAKAEAAKVPDASAELAALRGVLAAITGAFEAVIEEADRPKGGMGATFFEEFGAARASA